MVAERDFILSEQGAEEPSPVSYIPNEACPASEESFADLKHKHISSGRNRMRYTENHTGSCKCLHIQFMSCPGLSLAKIQNC